MPDANHTTDTTSDEALPVHDGDTPPEDQVSGMATAEDLENGEAS